MPVVSRIRSFLAVPAPRALLLFAVGFALTGCGATPDAERTRETSRDSPALPIEEDGSGGGSASASGEAGSVSAGADPTQSVPILRATSNPDGAPILYTLMLVNQPGVLPEPVVGALKPDFDREAVVFLGMGRQEGEGYGVRITDVRRSGDELTVAASFERPEGEARGMPTTPWSAVVVPKPEGVSGPLLSDFRDAR